MLHRDQEVAPTEDSVERYLSATSIKTFDM